MVPSRFIPLAMMIFFPAIAIPQPIPVPIPGASPPTLPEAAQVVSNAKGEELCFSTVITCTISLINIRFMKPFQAYAFLRGRFSILCFVASCKLLSLACCLEDDINAET